MKNKEQIKHILADFNFKRIHSVMTFLDWKWNFNNKEIKVPEVKDLISIATHCLNEVSNSEDSSALCTMGGFEAEKIEGTLELRFILERVNPLSPILNPDARNNNLARKA
jgi:hypothetical protein